MENSSFVKRKVDVLENIGIISKIPKKILCKNLIYKIYLKILQTLQIKRLDMLR